MSVLRLATQNLPQLYSTALKNGAAGAPAKEEDADFPMQNIGYSSRYRLWRTSAAPVTPVDVDFYFSVTHPVKMVGLANIRAYRGAAGIGTLEVFYGSDTAYPPASWVQALAPQAIASTANDAMFEIASPTSRSWRLRIANSGQFSCKPWLVRNDQTIDFTEGAGVVESTSRIRAPKSTSLLGGVMFNDLGVGKGATIKRWKIHDVVSSAQRTSLLAAQTRTLIFRDVYGAHYEVTPGAPVFNWGRSGILISTRCEVDYELEQVP